MTNPLIAPGTDESRPFYFGDCLGSLWNAPSISVRPLYFGDTFGSPLNAPAIVPADTRANLKSS